jgi:hypothetical protein
MYGLTPFGFYRPTKEQIRTELLTEMQGSVDTRIKIDVDSKIFRQMDMIAGEIDDIWEMGASIVNGLNIDTALGEQLRLIGMLRGLTQGPNESTEEFRNRVRSFKGYQRGLTALESTVGALPWVGRVQIVRKMRGAHVCIEVFLAKKNPDYVISINDRNALAAVFAEYGPEDVIFIGTNMLSYNNSILDTTFNARLNATVGLAGSASYAWSEIPTKLVQLRFSNLDSNDPHPLVRWMSMSEANRRSPENVLLRADIENILKPLFDTFDADSRISEDALLAVLYRTTTIRQAKVTMEGRDTKSFFSFYANRNVTLL